MLLAQEFDAVHEGQPYVSVHRRRIVTPDTLSRLHGYLSTAPVAAPGFRTDGKWVWPQRLADQVRDHGVAPQDQFYEHVRERYFLLPDVVSEDALWEAAVVSSGPPVTDPPPATDWSYAVSSGLPDGRPSALFRMRARSDGSIEEQYNGGRHWGKSFRQALADRGIAELELTAISERTAADVMDELAEGLRVDELVEARESSPNDGLLRLARVFDGQSPAGSPWFSPARLRLPEPVRRQRIAAYLSAGRPVLRAAGRMPDPLSDTDEPVLPLTYRTDGTWVWQEALAYYVMSRGVAPELEFLCHIEANGYQLPTTVDDDVASAGAALATAGASAPVERVPMTYYLGEPGVVCRARNNDYYQADLYRVDRRWSSTMDLVDFFIRGSDYGYSPVSEAVAVEAIDGRWLRDDAQPPFD